MSYRRGSDVDFDHGTLTVARSISDADGVVEVKGTKTHAIRRPALDSGTVDVRRERRDRAGASADGAGVSLSPSSYVWSRLKTDAHFLGCAGPGAERGGGTVLARTSSLGTPAVRAHPM